MNNAHRRLLNENEFLFLLVGSVVGIGIISIPNEIAKLAYEDAWISVLLGMVYPMYIVLLGSFMSKVFPEKNILVLSKEYLGKTLGTIFNAVFFSFFIFIASSIVSGYSNMITTFIVANLSPITIIAIVTLLGTYTSTKDIKVLGQISIIIFFITILMFISPANGINAGTIKNIYPILKNGIKPVIKAVGDTIFAYAGIETMLIIYPSVKNKNRILITSIKSVLIIALLYTWATFITIVYLGADVVIKSYWSFLLSIESLSISIVNNFRYIFMLFWGLIVFKTMSNYYFIAVTILNDMFKKADIKMLSLIIAPLIFFVALYEGNVVKRSTIISKVIVFYIIFNLIYVSLISLLILLKKDEKN